MYTLHSFLLTLNKAKKSNMNCQCNRSFLQESSSKESTPGSFRPTLLLTGNKVAGRLENELEDSFASFLHWIARSKQHKNDHQESFIFTVAQRETNGSCLSTMSMGRVYHRDGATLKSQGMHSVHRRSRI